MTATSGARARRPSAMCSAVASPGRRRVRREHDLAHRRVGALDARVELGDLEVLRLDAVDRRERAAEHVVAAAVLVRALDRDHVAGLLDDADQRGVAALVLADRAARALGQVEADLAEADPLLDVADRLRERVGVLGRRAQQVEREPLRRAVADAGELAQLGDQALDGRGEQAGYLCLRRAARLGWPPPGRPPPPPPSAAEAAEAAEHVHRRRRVHAAGAGRLALQLHRLAQRLVDRGHHHVLQHLDVVGVDRVGVDRERLELEVAAHRDLHHAAAGRGLDDLVLQLLLGGEHLLLHLLRLLQQGSEVGRLGHHDSSSAGSSSASNSRMKASTSSSSDSSGGARGARLRRPARRRRRSDVPVTLRIAVAICSRQVGSSALRLENSADSAQLSVSSPLVERRRARVLHRRVQRRRALLQVGEHGRPQLVDAGEVELDADADLGLGHLPSGSTTATAVTVGPPSTSARRGDDRGRLGGGGSAAARVGARRLLRGARPRGRSARDLGPVDRRGAAPARGPRAARAAPSARAATGRAPGGRP